MKEIMDLMQADPAFDVLFSFFGLGKHNFLSSSFQAGIVRTEFWSEFFVF